MFIYCLVFMSPNLHLSCLHVVSDTLKLNIFIHLSFLYKHIEKIPENLGLRADYNYYQNKIHSYWFFVNMGTHDVNRFGNKSLKRNGSHSSRPHCQLKHDLIVYAIQLNSSENYFFSNLMISIKTLIIPITNTLFIERD